MLSYPASMTLVFEIISRLLLVMLKKVLLFISLCDSCRMDFRTEYDNVINIIQMINDVKLLLRFSIKFV